MTNREQRPAANRRRVLALLVLLLIVGVIAMWTAFSLGKPLVVGELLWDLGLGLGVATSVSLVLSLYLQRIEDQEQRRIGQEARAREEDREERQRNQREQDQRFAQLNDDLDKLSKDADAIASEIHYAELEAQLAVIKALVESVQGELRNFRSANDKSYTHPDEALVEAIMDRMVEELRPDKPTSSPDE